MSDPDTKEYEKYIEYMNQRVSEHRDQVNNTPALLSLLYDLDLLPEQIENPINAARFITICELFKERQFSLHLRNALGKITRILENPDPSFDEINSIFAIIKMAQGEYDKRIADGLISTPAEDQ